MEQIFGITDNKGVIQMPKSDSQTQLAVISRVIDDDQKLKGFLIMEPYGYTQLVELRYLQTIMTMDKHLGGSSITFMNAEWDGKYGTLVGTHGVSLTDYPAIDANFNMRSKAGLVVTHVVKDRQSHLPAGVVAFNSTGTRFTVSFKKLEQLSRRINCVNFDIIADPNLGNMPVMKDGTRFPEIEMKVKAQNAGVAKLGNTNNKITQNSQADMPVIEVTQFTDEGVDKDAFYNAEMKWTESLLNMSRLSPYYSTVISAITKKRAPGLGTLAVTEDTLYYDLQFIGGMRLSELTFVQIHEVMHIAMQHSLRYGKRTNHDLWNIACDLYINSLICRDFGIKFGEDEKQIQIQGSKPAYIKTPPFGIFCDTTSYGIDLLRDTPETIYERLLKENPQMPGAGGQGQGQSQGQGKSGQSQQQQQGKGKGQPQPSQGQNQGSTGIDKLDSGSQQACQESGNSPSQQQNRSDIINGIGQAASSSLQGDNQGVEQACNNIQQAIDNMAQNGASQDAVNQMQEGLDQLKQELDNMQQDLQSQGQNQGQNQIDDLSEGSQGDGSPFKEVTVTLNGKRLSGRMPRDIMSNRENSSEDAEEDNRNKSRQTLQRIQTKIKMTEEETGQELVKNAGAGGALLQRYIDIGLSTGVRWQELLKNLCKTKPKKMFTLGNPNTDYMNMGMTLADRRAIGKPTHIGLVKFAIDVSGSVSKDELDFFLSEINNIFNYFKMDAELIYWSTMVGNAGEFSNIKEAAKIQPITDGGTDVACVFEYLAGETKVNGKFEKDKMKDVKAIFILTDGYFSQDYGKYAEKFGKKVVWLITGNAVTFSPLFGRVVPFQKD